MAITTTAQLRQSLDNDLNSNSWNGIYNIFLTLVQHTGKRKLIDPFQNPDGGDWNYIFFFFKGARFHEEELTLSRLFLDHYLMLQKKHKQRIHKGTPLQYLGLSYFDLNQMEHARKYHLLAFIEDLFTNLQNQTQQPPNLTVLLSTPASIVLEQRFRLSHDDLLDLQNYVISHATPIPENPEALYLEWIRKIESKSMLIARSGEERLYKPNLQYLTELKKQAFTDLTGKSLELFAYYVFSCVDGFEPILRKTTASFHFDVLVRNLVTEHPLLSNLGDYIGIECKNVNANVDVSQLDHFILKLKLHNMKCGVIFTNTGITGDQGTYGKAIVQKIFQRDGIIVFTLTKQDMNKLAKGCNLLSLLLRKYEDTRFT
jgi:hypothetical protein